MNPGIQKKLVKAQKEHAKMLFPGEQIIALLEPYILLTNARIIWLTWTLKAKRSEKLENVVSIKLIPGALGSKVSSNLLISLKDGKEEKLGMVEESIGEFFLEKFNSVIENPLELILTGNESPESSDNAGRVRAKAMFGANVVTIYENGFVKVSKGLGIIQGEIEELIDIFGESDITKKTGLGRAVGGVFTLGQNLILSPNQRGNLYLTISTNRRTHSLIWDRPSNTAISEMNKIVAAGKAVIKIKDSREEKETNKEPLQDVNPLDQLKKLKELLEIGAITEKEFDEKKIKLLGEI